ncbi:MAG: DMT family transporter [Acidimicrobiales bacterium]
MNAWILLACAIVCEVTATLALRASDGFSRMAPSVVVAIGYIISFGLLSQVLKTLPVGLVYAVWAGLGTAAVASLGWAIFGDALSTGTIAGIGLIVIGVVVVQVYGSPTH